MSLDALWNPSTNDFPDAQKPPKADAGTELESMNRQLNPQLSNTWFLDQEFYNREVPVVLPDQFYARFLSDKAKRQKPSPFLSFFQLEAATPGLISLLAGRPNPTTFPFTSFNFTVQSPIDPTSELDMSIEGDDLTEALQYGATPGLPKLLNWVRGLQDFLHGRKDNEGWTISMGCESGELLFKAITALVNEGDSVLSESSVDARVTPMFTLLNCDIHAITSDAYGVIPSNLRFALENWPSGKPKPKIFYTAPYWYDLYYYSRYTSACRLPSYFSLEVEEPEVGRVLRFDSLSTILSPGILMGFATGPRALLSTIDDNSSLSNLQVPSLTQMIVFKILDSWGYDGFKTHIEKVSEVYCQKRANRDLSERITIPNLGGAAE